MPTPNGRHAHADQPDAEQGESARLWNCEVSRNVLISQEVTDEGGIVGLVQCLVILRVVCRPCTCKTRSGE